MTEATLGYGRADVLTADAVFEVEPCRARRQAVRQALQYAAQTECRPAIALFGAARPEYVVDIDLRLRDGKPPVALWWYSDNHWRTIGSRQAASHVVREPLALKSAAVRRQRAGGSVSA